MTKNRGILDRPHYKQKAIQMFAHGKSTYKVAEVCGTSQGTAFLFKQREDIKALIEQEQMRLLEALPDAVENTTTLVRAMNGLPKDDIGNRKLSWDASKVVMEAGGVIPTSRFSQTLINIYQQNVNQFIPPVIQKLLEERNEQIRQLADKTIDITKEVQNDSN